MVAMAYETLRCESREDEIAVLTLNRPEKRNALSRRLRDEIVECLEALTRDESVKSVVLTGAGQGFCAGFDLSEFAEGNMEEIFARARDYHRDVYTFPKPLIAAVNGPAMAGGMDLALMCDIRIAGESAVFGQPQVKMGIPAAFDLVRTVVPEACAREICLSGRRVSAEEAKAIGLVNAVVADRELMDVVLGLAAEIAQSAGSVAMKAQFVETQPKLFEA
jgi:enoyl-CoA hydratase/carnithine racemase